MIEQVASTVGRQIRLGSVVTHAAWKEGRVDVTLLDSSKARTETLSARTVVIAVSLGVLAAPVDAPGAIAIDPPIASHIRAVELMAMGTVVKLVLRFEQAFWHEAKLAERLGVKRLDQMSFIQSNGQLDFPVWWSMYPIDAPLLIAWRGGPVGTEVYSRVGGANACVTLSRPVHNTICFAGEAADRLGRTGTVHGAIGSGWRAADEILRR